MTKPAMPENREAITVDWLRLALAAGGAINVPAIKDAVIEPIGAGVGLMAEILRCRLVYEDDAARGPESVIVKLPTPDPKSLRLSKQQMFYKREYAFYRGVAPHAPVRTPSLLYGDFEARGQRFVFVLEDLRGMETADEMAGVGAEQVKRAVRAVARLHGRFWNHVDQPPASGLHATTSLKVRPLVQLVYLVSLVPTLKKFGEFFSDDMRRLAEAFGPRIADYMGDVAAGPQTLIHGDFRTDNMFFGAEGGDDFAVIDWQASGIGSGLWDVAYFLGGSVSTETRRRIEREVLEEYHETVCGMGVEDFTFDDCWRLYRQNMLARLTVPIIICGGLDLSNERVRRFAESNLRRTLAVVEDLDAGEFLPKPRMFFGLAHAFSTASRLAYRGYKALR